jgi:hypothetical protein
MSQFNLFSIIFLSAALSVPAMANTTSVTWDQFVAQCQNPKGSKDKQFEPEDIRIQCTVTQREYVEELPGQFDLPAAQMISAAVVSNKLSVPAETRSVAAQGRAGECVRYKEVERTTRFTAPMTCEAVMKIALHGKGGEKGGGKVGTPADYCHVEAKGWKGKDAQEAVRDTGASRNSCPADARFPGHGKGDGKKS